MSWASRSAPTAGDTPSGAPLPPPPTPTHRPRPATRHLPPPSLPAAASPAAPAPSRTSTPLPHRVLTLCDRTATLRHQVPLGEEAGAASVAATTAGRRAALSHCQNSNAAPSRARTRRVHLFRACLDGLGWGAIGEPLPKPATFKVAGSTVSLTT